ncbi:MAG: hypothetical protein MZV49_16960 [Rhodopseudomonas palustris]|nr:hypothetical protein [Rhodopseudomonas palustris]
MQSISRAAACLMLHESPMSRCHPTPALRRAAGCRHRPLAAPRRARAQESLRSRRQRYDHQDRQSDAL